MRYAWSVPELHHALAKGPFASTIAGLVLVSGLPIFALDKVAVVPLFAWFLSAGVEQAVLTVVNGLVVIAGLFAVIVFWERLPLTTVGIYKPSGADFLLGLGGWIAISLVQSQVPVHQFQEAANGARQLTATSIAVLSHIPNLLWVAMISIAALAEELGVRAYIIERIDALSCSRSLAIGISLAISVVIHLPFWGFDYAVHLLPGEALLCTVYMLRRRLLPCLTAHMLYDLLPIRITLTA